MTDGIVAAILVGIGIVVGLLLLVAVARSRSRIPEQTGTYPALGMSLGMLLGGVLGTIVWVSTGTFVFWVIFTGGGMVSGLAIGSSWAARHG